MSETKIQRIINRSIEEISLVANKIPGVVIVHDLRNWAVAWMSQRGVDELGVSLEEIKSLSSEEYHSRYFNAEDSKDYAPKILGLMERNYDGESCTYFQQVRIKEHEDWRWHMSSTSILARDANNTPLLTITISFPIDAMHHMTAKAARLLEENNFLRRNLHLFSKLTKRERDVLRLIALGKSSQDAAKELYISLHTVETHRKNIRQKLDTNSFFELTQYARAFDLI